MPFMVNPRSLRSFSSGLKMKAWSLFCSLALASGSLVAAADPAAYVEPMWGTQGVAGHNPGVQRPWGAIFPGPESFNPRSSAGYAPESPLRGFAQMRLVGFYGPSAYGYPLITPTVGVQPRIKDRESGKTGEVAEVGYYAVTASKFGIRTEVTAAHDTAFYRFAFPKTEDGVVSLDLIYHQNPDSGLEDPDAPDAKRGPEPGTASITLDPKAGTMSGRVRAFHFFAKFSQPATAAGTWQGGEVSEGQTTLDLSPENGRKPVRGGGFLRFDTKGGAPVGMALALSYRSVEAAREMVERDMAAGDFDKTRAACRAAWNDVLSRVEITLPDPPTPELEEARRRFYTTLYNTQKAPRDRTTDSPFGNGEPLWDDVINTWDTWMTVYPLVATLYPEKAREQALSFLNRLDTALAQNAAKPNIEKCRENKWWHANDPSGGFSQGGQNPGNFLVELIRKGVPLPEDRVYAWLRHHADVVRASVKEYAGDGFLGMRTFGHDTSRVLEWYYNDHLAAWMASRMGDAEKARRYRERSLRWVTLWNPEIESAGFRGFIHPRDRATGAFIEGFDPKTPGPNFAFCEGSGWVYHYYPMTHDAAGLIAKMGGREKAIARFEWFMENKPHWLWGNNEPGLMVPYFGHLVGRPDIASEYNRMMLDKAYGPPPGGVAQDDGGALSARYVLAALGIYNITGSDRYFVTAPLFPETAIHWPEGRTLRITVPEFQPGHVFVKSAKLNGKPLEDLSFLHAGIANGGALEIELTAERPPPAKPAPAESF